MTEAMICEPSLLAPFWYPFGFFLGRFGIFWHPCGILGLLLSALELLLGALGLQGENSWSKSESILGSVFVFFAKKRFRISFFEVFFFWSVFLSLFGRLLTIPRTPRTPKTKLPLQRERDSRFCIVSEKVRFPTPLLAPFWRSFWSLGATFFNFFCDFKPSVFRSFFS